jgi:protein SCO1/2
LGLGSPKSGDCGALDAQVHQVGADDVKILDLPVVTARGESVSFARDVVGDRLVAVNFIFTTCPSVCPIQSAIFAGIQKELGDRLGRDVHLVSISIDPKTDVPQRLQAYADRYHAGPGWTWVTGSKEDIDHILVGLGAYSRVVEEHAAMILVGDGRNGGWTRFYGFPKPTSVLERIDELAAARNDEPVARNRAHSRDAEAVVP